LFILRTGTTLPFSTIYTLRTNAPIHVQVSHYHLVCTLKCFQCPRGLRGGCADSKPALGSWISVSCECCTLSGRGLQRDDRSSGGVLPDVACLQRDRVEEALAH
jgi:hypothetical protein